MTSIRRVATEVWGWATDWRTGAVLVATGVVAFLIVVYVTNYDTAQDALTTRDRTAASATRRIDKLNAQLNEQDDRIGMLEREAGRRDAALQVLAEQIRRDGGDPIVVNVTNPPATTTTTTTTSPPSTTTTTQPPQPDEEPSDPDDCSGLSILGACIGG